MEFIENFGLEDFVNLVDNSQADFHCIHIWHMNVLILIDSLSFESFG